MATSYLTRTVTGSSTTKATYSAWVKRSGLGEKNLTAIKAGSDQCRITFTPDDELQVFMHDGSYQYRKVTDRLFRDTSGYYNIVIAFDSTEGAAGDRIKIYVNGVQETAFNNVTDPGASDDCFWFQSATGYLGIEENGSSNGFDGLMTHINMIQGTAYAASTFGEFDSTSGIWKIKTGPSVTYGSQGFFLKMETTSGSGMGTDSSGNGNNYAENGSPTQTIDNPSNVLCTWNSLAQPNGTLSNGNLSVSGVEDTPGTLGVNKGKWYWEYKRTNTTNSLHWGICSTKEGFNKTSNQMLNGLSNSVGAAIYIYEGGTGTTGHANAAGFSSTSYSGVSTPSIANGDIVGCALDISTSSGTLEWFNNGVSLGSATFTYDDSVSVYPFVRQNSGSTGDVNFGSGYFGTTAISSAGTSSTDDDSVWEYDCPANYYGLNTRNINTYG